MLSVCLIAKNEEVNLEKVLSSIKPVADEIVLTDTGSTDRTIEIATAFGARICHYQWNDDLSAARNYCYKQAKGDWIFWIDCDEVLLPESVEIMKQCLNRDDVVAFLILRQDLIDLDRPDLYSEMWLPRLFRNHKDIYLQGCHHEQFTPPLSDIAQQEGLTVETSQVRIRHTGFAGPKRKEKFQRDVRLLDRELTERPGQLYYQIELFRTLLLMGDVRWKSVFEEATTNLKKFIDDEKPPTPLTSLLLETLLQLPESELPQGFTRKCVQVLAHRWFPRSAPLMWVLAKQDYEKNQFEQAEKRLCQLIQMGKEHSYDRSVGFDPHIFAEEAQMNLAVCLIRQAKLNEAVEILEPLTQKEQYKQAATQNLNAIKGIQNRLTRNRRKGRRK
jgi:hypothetical protein